MGMIEKFQQDLRNGMTLEKALNKHHLTLKEAVEYSPKPITTIPNKKTPYKKRNCYTHIDLYISKRADVYHLRKQIKGKAVWGGSYNSLEDAQQVREYLEEHGWDILTVKEACEKYNIQRRKR